MGFILILALVTLSIAGSAAFFSVYGLAQIFAGSFLPVVFMASSLEAGKLMAASFAYRYWLKITTVMKAYLILATLLLMVITSAGIFGFLSAAYQQDILPIKIKKQQIALLTSEKTELVQLKAERLARKKQIDKDIASLPNNFITGRQRLMKSYGSELAQLKKDVSSYTSQLRDKTLEISRLKNETLKSEAHVGPIIFIAKAFGQDVDDATKWLVLLIIFVFDPLAVTLTIGVNIALADHKKQKAEAKSDGSLNTEVEPEPQITSLLQLNDFDEDHNEDEEYGFEVFGESLDNELPVEIDNVTNGPEDSSSEADNIKADDQPESSEEVEPIQADEPIVTRPRPMSSKVYKPHNYVR